MARNYDRDVGCRGEEQRGLPSCCKTKEEDKEEASIEDIDESQGGSEGRAEEDDQEEAVEEIGDNSDKSDREDTHRRTQRGRQTMLSVRYLCLFVPSLSSSTRRESTTSC
jgi:hypothetical protein